MSDAAAALLPPRRSSLQLFALQTVKRSVAFVTVRTAVEMLEAHYPGLLSTQLYSNGTYRSYLTRIFGKDVVRSVARYAFLDTAVLIAAEASLVLIFGNTARLAFASRRHSIINNISDMLSWGALTRWLSPCVHGEAVPAEPLREYRRTMTLREIAVEALLNGVVDFAREVVSLWSYGEMARGRQWCAVAMRAVDSLVAPQAGIIAGSRLVPLAARTFPESVDEGSGVLYNMAQNGLFLAVSGWSIVRSFLFSFCVRHVPALKVPDMLEVPHLLEHLDQYSRFFERIASRDHLKAQLELAARGENGNLEWSGGGPHGQPRRVTPKEAGNLLKALRRFERRRECHHERVEWNTKLVAGRAVPKEMASCVICQDDFEDDTPVRRLHCGHSFCSACIERWLEKDDSCPLCKARALRVSPLKLEVVRSALMMFQNGVLAPYDDVSYLDRFCLHLVNTATSRLRSLIGF